MVARTDPGPGTQMGVRGEMAHVSTNFRQDDLRATLTDSGYLAERLDIRLGLRHVRFRHPVQLMDTTVQVIDVVENLGQQFPL